MVVAGPSSFGPLSRGLRSLRLSRMSCSRLEHIVLLLEVEAECVGDLPLCIACP